jgi:uncharacterized protein (TIGR00369 family)
MNVDGRGVARYVGVTMRETGDWEHGEIVLEATAPLRPHLAGSGGALVTGALLTMADNVAGFCGGLAVLPDGWVQTINLALRRTRFDVAGTLRFRSTVLRTGRTSAVTDIVVDDDAGRFATGVLTSAVMQPDGGAPQWERPARLDGLAGSAPDEELAHVHDWMGLRTLADGAELDVVDDLRNPWGIVHGGITASLIDAAALAVVPDGVGVADATIHYLAPSRVGPLRATGRVLGRRSDDVVVRVEVRDVGRDRTTAMAIAAVRIG